MPEEYWSEEYWRKMYAQVPPDRLFATMVGDIRAPLNTGVIHLTLLRQEIVNPNEKIFTESHEQTIDRVLKYLDAINAIMNAALYSKNPDSY